MHKLLFARSTGDLSAQAFTRIQTSQLVGAIQPWPELRFNGGEREAALEEVHGESSIGSRDSKNKVWAHQAGVNSLAIDVENRLLLSGGADSSVRLWDLQEHSTGMSYAFKPIASITRTASAHKYGITHLGFYPFDSAAFLSSSYDHHLKLYATETQQVSADFDLNSIIYAHALSPIASHLLVACATQHPNVRLVDLRSGSNTHSMTGHRGALLSLAWSPRLEHILASGGIDGTIRLWDIRKSSASLGVLDMEDSTGIAGTDGMGRGARQRGAGKGHQGAVNGITWTDDGCYIVSAGHDQRVRVWDAATGANTLASFGPTLKNSHLSCLPLAISPTSSVATGEEMLFYPNERELLVFQLHQGRLLKRLKVPGPNIAAVRSRTGERNVKSRITGLAWRAQADGVYSAHTDGQIRAWLPKMKEDYELEEENDAGKRKANYGDDEGERKRRVLDDVFRDLTKQKVTFG